MIVAAAILAIGFYLADVLSMFIGSMSSASKMSPDYRRVLARVARYAVITFAVMTALVQLRVVPELVQIIMAGLVLALALAFGLGGKDHARDLISALRGQNSKPM